MKKFTKAIIGITAGFMSVPFLVGCGEKGKWEYSKGDLEQVTFLDGNIGYDEGSKRLTYSINESYPYFLENVKEDDLVCFDLTKLEDAEGITQDDLYNINTFKNFSVKTYNIAVNSDQNKLTFEFDGNQNDLFACLISREGTSLKNILYSESLISYAEFKNRLDQDAFEEKYLAKAAPKYEDDKLNIYDYYDEVVSEMSLVKPTNEAALPTQNGFNPQIVIKALRIVAKVVSTIYGFFKEAKTPIIEDVYDKLLAVEENTNRIQKMISDNFNKSFITKQELEFIKTYKFRT